MFVPSLAILFGLVLRGRFDKDFTSAEAAPREHPAPARSVALVALAVSLGAVGLPLVLAFDGGPLLAAGAGEHHGRRRKVGRRHASAGVRD